MPTQHRRLPVTGEFAAAPGTAQLEDQFDPDAWGAMLDQSEQPAESSPPPTATALPNLSAFAPIIRKANTVSPFNTPSKPSTSQGLAPPISNQSRSISAPALSAASQVATSPRSPARVASPPAKDADAWDSNWTAEGDRTESASSAAGAASLAGMSKEEKAAEMARRREERKQVRI